MFKIKTLYFLLIFIPNYLEAYLCHNKIEALKIYVSSLLPHPPMDKEYFSNKENIKHDMEALKKAFIKHLYYRYQLNTVIYFESTEEARIENQKLEDIKNKTNGFNFVANNGERLSEQEYYNRLISVTGIKRGEIDTYFNSILNQ